jgi:hypothetical protein
MSQKEAVDPIADLDTSESASENLSRLTELARQAFEQKRTKDCLDLTRAILLIDPDHAQAQSMRSAMQSEMHRDLENSRAFLRRAASRENAGGESEPVGTSPATEQPIEETVLAPGAERSSRQNSKRRWVVRIGMVLGIGIIFASLPRPNTKSTPVEAAPLKVTLTQPDPAPPGPTTEAAETSAPTDLPTVEQVMAVNRPAPAPVVPATPAPLQAKLPDPKPVTPVNGTLAVSSPTSIDIYQDDAYLGSAPVSLDLPAGPQTLEYRHGGLRRFVTHIIKGNETTKTMITFDVTVQINSKPWAEVFLDGVDRKDLGQTPLSGVRVPIGGVLTFQNPQFQAKKYRITGNETGIQIVFP